MRSEIILQITRFFLDLNRSKVSKKLRYTIQEDCTMLSKMHSELNDDEFFKLLANLVIKWINISVQ